MQLSHLIDVVLFQIGVILWGSFNFAAFIAVLNGLRVERLKHLLACFLV